MLAEASGFRLVAGLGNPGQRYVKTRHSIGFQVVEEFVRRHGDPNWKQARDHSAAEVVVAGQPVLFIKPESYMNRSGGPVGSVARYYDLSLDEIVIVHDDIDLEFGSLRIKSGGGHGGHNGIRSVMETFSDGEFVRLRIGVGRPPDEVADGFEIEVSDWVLSKFSPEEEKLLEEYIDRAQQALEALLTEGTRTAQNRFN